jgi:hypothetical protein
MATVNGVRAQPGWTFWLLWMCAVVAGALAGMFASAVAFAVVGLISPATSVAGGSAGLWRTGLVTNVIGFAALGAAIGFVQWWLLRRYLPGTGWWILATLGGYSAIGMFPLFSLPFTPAWLAGSIMLTMVGVVLGVLQWLVLRAHVYQAGWWIVVSTAGWALAVALIGAANLTGVYVEPLDLLSVLLIPVAVAGGGMIWLLRRSSSIG